MRLDSSTPRMRGSTEQDGTQYADRQRSPRARHIWDRPARARRSTRATPHARGLTTSCPGGNFGAHVAPHRRGFTPINSPTAHTRGPPTSHIAHHGHGNLGATPARAGIHRPDGRPGGASRPTRLGITRASRNPRAGADQPLVAILIERGHSPTPHPRGSTHDEELIRGHSGHRPAPAGKQPRSGVKPWHCPVHTGIDRINTGDRQSVCRPSADTNALPRVRGSSRGCAAFRVIRRRGPSQRESTPLSALAAITETSTSPPQRGSTHVGRPAGDRPLTNSSPSSSAACTPPRRGSTDKQSRIRDPRDSAPPARGSTCHGAALDRLPRIHGDRPTSARRRMRLDSSTPRMRGSTQALIGRTADRPHSLTPRLVGDRPVSATVQGPTAVSYPAHVGLDPDPTPDHAPCRDGDRPPPGHQHATSDSSRKPLTPDRQRSISPVHLSTR